MVIKKSAEDYLEAILMIRNKKGNARSIDVANKLNVSKPSVSVAMKNFREEGYITVNEDGDLSLTEKGMAIAKRIYERHQVIAKALILIGVDEDIAYEDSCKIEHDISDMTLEKVKEYIKKSI